MRILVFVVCLLTSQCVAQYDDDDESQNGRSGNELGSRPSVPGDLGDDYPTLGHIPKTSFSCAGREPGYYADMETNCQVFRVCTSGSNLNFQSFLCPIGTLFNQAVSVCDWWKNVKCEKSEEFINNNIEKFNDLKFGPQLMSDVKKMLTHSLRNSYDESTLQDDNLLQENLHSQEQAFSKNSAVSKTQSNENIYFSATTTKPQHTYNSQPKQYTQITHNRGNRQYDEIQRAQNAKGTSQQTQFSNSNNYANQHKPSLVTDTPFLKFSDDINDEVGNEAKQNLALVFSLLADSLNGAKEYSNIAQSNEPTTTQPPTYQNHVQNTDLSKYSKRVSRLTSTQYSDDNNKNVNRGNIASLYQSNSSQHKAKYTSNSSNPNKFNANSKHNYSANTGKGNLLNKQNEIYSGQLYQHPVPDVTNYINNNNKNFKNSETTDLLSVKTNKNFTHKQNSHEQSSTEVEIIQSHSFEPSSAKLQISPADETDNQLTKNKEKPEQAFKNKYLNAKDGISAQVQDKVTGTIPHPSEKNKVVTFKRDNSFFVFKKIEDNGKGEKEASNAPVNKSDTAADQQSAKLTHESNTNNIATYSFVPSVGFEVENEVKGLQNFANKLVDDTGKANNGYLVNAPDFQQNIQTSDVDVSIDHSTPAKQNVLSALYTGPSSYSAPQSSVGSLNTKRDVSQQNVNYNTRLEQLDDYNRNDGFSKFTPIRQFNF